MRFNVFLLLASALFFSGPVCAGGTVPEYFGKEIGCRVRVVSNLDKVGIADAEPGRLLEKKTAPVMISAARHEFEGFQIVLQPLPDFKKKVKLSVTDLTGAKAIIPQSNVTTNPVGYLRYQIDKDKEAIWPDPLLIGDIPDLKYGENQPVWITVKVPDNAPAGYYRGSIVISAKGVEPLAIPLILKVKNFNIPKKISLKSSFWSHRNQINYFFHEDIGLDDYFKWVDMALEHRLNPIDMYAWSSMELIPQFILPTEEDKKKGIGVRPVSSLDFSKWDKYVDRMVAGGTSTIALSQTSNHGMWFVDKDNPVGSPGHIEKLTNNLKMMSDYFKKKGIFDLHYVQLRDETSSPESIAIYKAVHEKLPDLKLLLTAPHGEGVNVCQIPCPLTNGFNEKWRDEVKAKGGEFWWYVCCEPRYPWANFYTERPATHHRALFWQTWDRKVEGILYWGLNFYCAYDIYPSWKWPDGAKGPTTRLPEKGAPNYSGLPGAWGDGQLMYPGDSIGQPLSSIRLEVARDGEEDYEYLIMLDKLIAEAEVKGNDSAVVKSARAARKAAHNLIASMTDYEKNSEPYQKVRERVGDAIERLLAEHHSLECKETLPKT